MNAAIKDPSHASILYYDSDYPSRDFPVYPENFDSIVVHQGISDDINRYQQLALENGKNILELCCGTGRVGISLLMAGCKVTAVDISGPLLKRFEMKIREIENLHAEKLTLVKQDVTKLSLPNQDFDMVICAFNSLLCIPDFELQQETLVRAAAL